MDASAIGNPWEPEVEAYLATAFGAAGLRQINECLSRPPLNTCIRVNSLKATTQDIIARVMDHAEREQEGWLKAGKQAYVLEGVPCAVIVPGCGPNVVDYACCGSREVVVNRKAGEAMLRGAPLYVPGVLACSAGIAAGDLVAVSVALELPGSHTFGFTRGTTLGSAHDHHSSSSSGALPPRLRVGVGRAHLSRSDMFRRLNGVAVSLQHRLYDVPSCSGVQQGDCMLQNLPSIVAAQVLGPLPGSRVLDMCAAPGGKATLLAQLMGDTGCVLALDRSHAKVLEIEKLAQELGLSSVRAFRMDSTRALIAPRPSSQPPPQQAAGSPHTAGDGSCLPDAAQAATSACSAAGSSRGSRLQRVVEEGWIVEDGFMVFKERGGDGGGGGKGEAGKRAARKAAARQLRGHAMPATGAAATETDTGGRVLRGFFAESFDAVLLDAPCTALGLRPRLLQRQSMLDLRQTATYQRQLIDVAVQLLRPGGSLVYSTCTINPGENEANVRYALDTYPCLQLVPQTPYLGCPGLVTRPRTAPGTGPPAATPPPAAYCCSQPAASSSAATPPVPAQAGPSHLPPAAAGGPAGGAPPPSLLPPHPQPPAQGGAALAAAAASAAAAAGAAPGEQRHPRSAALADSEAGAGSGAASGGQECGGSSGGAEGGEGERWLSSEEAGLVQRFSPLMGANSASGVDTIGFFIAKFLKAAPSPPSPSK